MMSSHHLQRLDFWTFEEALMQKPEAVLALNRLGVEIYAALEYGCLVRETWRNPGGKR